MTEENLSYSPIKELLTVANQFCKLVENISNFEAKNIIDFMRKILPLLYVKGCTVKAEPNADDSLMQRYVTEETYEIVFNEVRNKLLGNNKFYFFDSDLKEPIEMTLAESITDIYQDLKDFQIAYMRGLEPERISAVFCICDWFVFRWGRQISYLMPTLHNIYEDKIKNGTDFE